MAFILMGHTGVLSTSTSSRKVKVNTVRLKNPSLLPSSPARIAQHITH
jgi:hypothetical protein